MRVVLHGFGSFPVMFWHMIQHAKTIKADVEWGIILSSDHYEHLFCDLLGAENVMVLSQSAKQTTLDEAVYPGALYKDIEAEKRNFKYAPAAVQYSRAMVLYLQIERFMSGFSPTHAFVSQVEGFDGKAFIAAARKQNAEVVVPTGCRNLGGIFFSSDDFETLPAYTFNNPEEYIGEATAFLEKFRHQPVAATGESKTGEDNVLADFTPPVYVRTLRALKRWLVSPEQFEWDNLRASVLNNLPYVRDGIWRIRRFLNQRYCDIRSVEDLPEKFIFYPLQYSPESSINTPAPYFLDQMRAIDAIRFAMPSDCQLIIKEHPACILLRDGSFVKRLQHTAGVMVVHYTIPSLELVKRSGLTISVTGTATLEAMLLKKPAITLGPSLISHFLGGVCELNQLPKRIESLFGKTLPDQDIIEALACLFSIRHEIVFGSPGIAGEPVLRRKNIERFTEAFFQHCRLVG